MVFIIEGNGMVVPFDLESARNKLLGDMVMSKKCKKVCRINDGRLAGYTKRTRSGSQQVFYTGNDERDFDRYRAEGMKEMHDKPDTIRMQPPERHYCAELIDDEWWWVNGCEECCGEEPVWSYVKCEKHDVCETCGTHRSKLTDIPWGTRTGFRCKPCQEMIDETEKQDALSKVGSKEYDEWDYFSQDKVTCPH